MAKRKSGLARYQDVDNSYLEERRLRRRAGWVLLWALGVGAVISGDYFGWNFGLEAGGFWGLAIATIVMAAMYLSMVFSIAELSAALPHAGGFYSFVRSAFGPTGGFICGITDTIEYVITPAVIVVGIGGYLNELAGGIFGESPQVFAQWTWLWWLLSYAVFVYIKLRLTRPELERPYRSPLGIPGAACGVVLSLIAMAATLAQEDLRPAVVGVAIFLVIGLVYYLAYSRHRLVAQAPEEEVALIAEAEDELAHK